MKHQLSSPEAVLACRRCELLSGLPADTLNVLAALMQTEHFGAGETICAVGEVADGIFLIAAGEVDVLLPDRAGVVRRMGAGEIIGEYGLFDRGVRTSTVKAVGDATLLSLDYDHFLRFLLEYPESALSLLRVTVGRLVERERAAGST